MTSGSPPDGTARSPDTAEEDETVAPDEAFLVLGHELRIEVLLALWRGPDAEMTFSELRTATEVRDSGQFSYHLDKLVGTYVERTEAGYRLRRPGVAVVNAIRSGAFNEVRSRAPVELDDPCQFCGGPLAFRYRDNVGEVRCAACDGVHAQHGFPPGGLADRPMEAVPAAFDRFARASLDLAVDGVCHECAGPVEMSIRPDGPCGNHPVAVALDCERCEVGMLATVGELLLADPRVTALLTEEGVDVSGTPLWAFPFAADGDRTRVESRDPWRFVVRVTLGGDPYEVAVGESLSVESVREP